MWTITDNHKFYYVWVFLPKENVEVHLEVRMLLQVRYKQVVPVHAMMVCGAVGISTYS
jgi:hypothetical protein